MGACWLDAGAHIRNLNWPLHGHNWQSVWSFLISTVYWYIRGKVCACLLIFDLLIRFLKNPKKIFKNTKPTDNLPGWRPRIMMEYAAAVIFLQPSLSPIQCHSKSSLQTVDQLQFRVLRQHIQQQPDVSVSLCRRSADLLEIMVRMSWPSEEKYR